MKFFPVVVTVLITFIGTLACYCVEICYMPKCDCVLFYLPMEQNSTLTKSWADEEYSFVLNYSQNIVVLIILLHFGKFVIY